jgi:plastocyanin
MRRVVLLFVLVAMLAVPAGSAFAIRPETQPTAVGIAEREHYITPYRRSVPVGLVKLNIRNYGEDVHNLVIRGPRRFVKVGPDIEAGTGTTWTVRLRRPGTYQLLCTRANHLKLGMKSKIKVVKPRAKKR